MEAWNALFQRFGGALEVTNFFLTNGANYNNIIATLDPRTAQLALRLEF